MSKWLEELKEKLDSMSQEELDVEFERIKPLNEIGPTIDEYISCIKESAENKVKIAESEIHKMELNGTWVNDKPKYRELKKVLKYWTEYLNKLNR